jgi:anti-sigma-K factor RskA
VTPRPTLSCDEVRDLAPLYAIGALDDDEAAVVRDHLAGCEDAHAEVDAMGEAVAALADVVEPMDPPAGLKDRLMAAAAADLAEGRHPASATAARAAQAPAQAASAQGAPAAREPDARGPSPDSTPPTAAPVIILDRERRRPSLAWLVAAAAVIGVVALAGLNLAQRRELDAASAYRDGVASALQLAGQPGSQTALLTAEDGSVSGLGVVGSDGSVELVMRGLAATTGTQVYTAWTIAPNAAPVALGDFTVGSDGVAVATAQSPGTSPGDTLALTLESAGGHQAPAGPIVAAGVTQAPTG